jgi:HTH-type transcriptional regulator / antitoxin MqsA
MTTKNRICGHCGGVVRHFARESFVAELKGRSATAQGLSGWRCTVCNETEFDAESAARYAKAGDDLLSEERARLALEIKRIRTVLRLTQLQAGRITGGGPNAFSRYERGEAKPMPAVLNLLRLLERHPELLREIQDETAARL